jgi:peptidoglycan hydrolase-like protein with peptidoglycan-binding domain
MKKLFAVLIIGLLGLWPMVIESAQSTPAGEQPPEQRRLLTKDQIQQVQERLKAEGVDPGPVDGVMNPQTEAALRQFQQKRGLPTSGAVDEATLRELQITIAPGGTGTR